MHETSFRKALKAHLKIVYGTGHGRDSVDGTDLAQEFQRMVTLGMGARWTAIQSATSRAADDVGHEGMRSG